MVIPNYFNNYKNEQKVWEMPLKNTCKEVKSSEVSSNVFFKDYFCFCRSNALYSASLSFQMFMFL